jgi:hypothetical protein
MKEARITINSDKYDKSTDYDDEFCNINESYIHIAKPQQLYEQQLEDVTESGQT